MRIKSFENVVPRKELGIYDPEKHGVSDNPPRGWRT
jgi:hypothetical protein